MEIEDADAWNVVSKGNKDLNVIDVYAEWCGPCMCLIRAPPPLSVPPPPCQTSVQAPFLTAPTARVTAQRPTRKSYLTTTRC